MSQLTKFVIEHATRGDCKCGNCSKNNAIPNKNNTISRPFIDVQFFKVLLKENPSDEDKKVIKNDLIQLIKNHKGEFREINLFDGEEHNFIDIGAWIGDQGLALMLMGMGELLGIWELRTPNKVAPDFSDETKMMLAEAGYISIYKNIILD